MLGIVTRDLKDSQGKDVSDDWRFAIAYNAALQAATAALAAAGYRRYQHFRSICFAHLAILSSVSGESLMLRRSEP